MYSFLTLDAKDFALINSIQVWILGLLRNPHRKFRERPIKLAKNEFNRAAGMSGLSRETRGTKAWVSLL